MFSAIIESIRGRETRMFKAGEVILQEGESTGLLFVLKSGSVEVLKNGVPVALASQPGVVFGEMATLMNSAHTATVRAMTACEFYQIENSREFLKSHPEFCFHLCELLAHRLDTLNHFIIDLKTEIETGDVHRGVDEIFETLLYRQKRERTPSMPVPAPENEAKD